MPLSGLRVLDLSRLFPGPFCTQLLGDMGADVIKIEDTGAGDQVRSMAPLLGESSAGYFALNRNKRAIQLDLKSPSGSDAFLRLCDGADVVVESFRPGVMERLGLGFATLHDRNPRLVMCSISGYGQDGPYRGRAGHDLNYQALSGIQGMTGTLSGELAIPAVQIGDLGAGALGAAVAILAALHHRQRSGEGQHCDVSMLDGLVSWLSIHAAQHFAGEPPPGPGGGALTGRYPCYGLYRCADGAISVAALEPKFWGELVRLLGLPHLHGLAFATGAEATAVHHQLEQTFLTRTRAEWSRALEGHDVCCEPVLTLAEVFDDPQVVHRRLRIDEGVGGPLAQVGFPFQLSATPLSVRRAAPRQGQHTREVLLEAGLSPAEVDRLASAGGAV